MFGALGFVPGITPDQLAASTKRGGWDAAGVPKVTDYMTVGAEIGGRATLSVTLPFTLFQSGHDPAPVGVRGGRSTRTCR